MADTSIYPKETKKVISSSSGTEAKVAGRKKKKKRKKYHASSYARPRGGKLYEKQLEEASKY